MRKEIGRCEWCRRGRIFLHEIAQGFGKRHLALDKRGLVIGLCFDCHRKIHSLGLKGKVIGLAILRARRPQDYNLQLFWEVNGRRWPDHEEVLAAEIELP